MAVAVEEGVDAVRGGNHLAVGPGGALRLVAHVSHHDHVLGAGGAYVVNGLLHGVVNELAAFILEETVDELAVLVHEVTRRGAAQGVGGGNADEADLHAADFFDDPRVKDKLAALVEVAADVGELRSLDELEETVHTVIELMVAGDREIVSDGVHDVDQAFALGHGADGFALDGVAVVDQEHVVILGQVFFYLIQSDIAPTAVNGAVDVAREEDRQIPLLGRRLTLGKRACAAKADEQRYEEAERESQRQCFFHIVSSCIKLGFRSGKAPIPPSSRGFFFRGSTCGPTVFPLPHCTMRRELCQ